MSLMSGLLDTGRTLYTDNYYTSVSLASQLLQRQTHLVGTVRSNRKGNSKELLTKKLKKHEVIGQESGTGIVMLKWKDTRDVLVLTTAHTDEVMKVRQRGKEIEKPLAIVEYNKSKAYIDLSDQLKTYSHCLRRGNKWYRKLATELIFGSALVNAFIINKEITRNKIQITEFREGLSLSLVGFDKHKICTEPDANHELQERTKCRCTVCYAKIKEP
ncbi:Transposase IS4 [Popillia japonica]|uniref:Transposase IS4 n=1 Tax=Popillia japonica TaxID=7064 RepID=A0AAW1ITK9_POPJA